MCRSHRNRQQKQKGRKILMDCAKENNLLITNPFFREAVNRYWIWVASGKVTKNQTDFILSSDRKIVGNCEVIKKWILAATSELSELE